MMKNELEILTNILGKDAHIISPLVGGMMNKSFIVKNNKKKYVLYISTTQANEMVNRELEKDNQEKVYSLSLTSKNVYFDTRKGIKINEYIEGDSLDKVCEYDLNKVQNLLKTLHNSNNRCQNDYLPFERLENYRQEAISFHELSKEFKELENCLMQYKEWLLSQPKVMCHNDAQKSNIIKGDDDKYYLIDFEFMGNNDPIYDIATFGNGTVQEGFELLKAYCNNNPNIDEIKRYYLWRIFVSLQWYLVAIVKHYRGEGKTHGFDFMNVANFFLKNAEEAYNNFVNYK